MSRFRKLFRHEDSAARVDRAIDDELTFHFDMTLRELADKGYSPEDAEREAQRRFGDVRLTRERLRSVDHARVRIRRRADLMDLIRQQITQSLRALRRQPVLAVAIIATFALGLGANAAMFTLIDRLLVRPPGGVSNAEGVRRIYFSEPGEDGADRMSRGLAFEDVVGIQAALRDRVQIGAYASTSQSKIGRGSGAPRVDVHYATQGYFDVLGVRPKLGRFFLDEEVRPELGAATAAVLSAYTWQRVFQSDPQIIGKTFELDHDRFTIVGVAADQFNGVEIGAAGVWLPASAYRRDAAGSRPWYVGRGYRVWHMLARPAHPGDRALATQLGVAYRQAIEGKIRSARDTLVTMVPSPLLVARGPGEKQSGVSIAFRLAGVAWLILLVACANIAHLLLVRSIQRRKEIAVRLALGVSRARLISQLLLESMLLSLAGGLAAVGVAQWGGGLLRATILPFSNWAESPVDFRVLLFTLAVATFTGLAAGVVPAAQASRRDILDSLRDGARAGGARQSRLRVGLVVVQASLSLVLLVGAGLFVRSLQRASAVDTGFDVDRLLTARLPNAADSTKIDATRARIAALADGVRQLPGVERVALASVAPLGGFGFATLHIDGLDSVPALESGPPSFSRVSPGYFATAGIRVVLGRAITDEDRFGRPLVAVVNELMARTIWPDESPLGKCLRVGPEQPPCARVVGVVENSHRMSLVENPTMQYYLSLAQSTELPSVMVVRADPGAQMSIQREIDRRLALIAPDGDLSSRPLSQRVSAELRPWRTGATLFSLCGLLALLVATMGVYSTVAYTVSERRHEFGVRLALGAQLGDVVRIVVGAGLRTMLVGIALGIVASLAAGRLVSSLLYDTRPSDPVVLVGVAGLLVAAAIVGSLVPSLRAARTDPLEALKSE